jgi:hypothetical protein
MSNEEITFLMSLGAHQPERGAMPPFTLGMGTDKARLAINSKLVQVTRFRDWVIVTMSTQDFKEMVKTVVTSLGSEEEMRD